MTLRQLRLDRGLLQKQVGYLVGRTPSYLSELERGLRPPPSTPVLEKFVAALQLNEQEADTLRAAATVSKQHVSVAAGMHPQARALIHRLSKQLPTLSEDKLHALMLLLRVFEGEKTMT